MSPVQFPVQPQGFSLLEVLLVTSIVATLAAVSIPVTAGALDELRTSMAARYLEGRIMHARATAVKRSGNGSRPDRPASGSAASA